jgi:uncharacterized protein (DUF1330 family)
MNTANNSLLLISGMALGVVMTVSFTQSKAQAPAGAVSTRPAVFVITEQTINNQERYDKEYAQQVTKTIKDHNGRFVVRTTQIENMAGEPGPKRLVVLGFESLDQVKKWQSDKAYTDLKPIRDEVMKLRQYAVHTCAAPGQQAQAGQTSCP